jgi:hypothetical protein
MGKLVEVEIKFKWTTSDNDRKWKIHRWIHGAIGNLEEDK